MDKLILLITMLTSFLALTGSFAVFPYISRKTVSFGISIPENAYSDENVALIRKKYRNLVLLTGFLFMLGLACMVYFSDLSSGTEALLLGIMMFVNIFVVGFVYLWAHKNMKKLKSENKWGENVRQLVTVNTDFRKKNMMLSPLWFISYILIMAATVTISLILFDSLPDQIPMQYNAAGEVVRYADKTYGLILYMPVTQMFITFLFIFVYYSIAKSKQQIDPANREKTLSQNIIFRKRWSAYVVILGLILLLIFAGTQLSILGVVSYLPVVIGSIAFTVVIAAATVIIAVTTGQSGSRVKVVGINDSGASKKKTIVRDDDNHWKWGVFYYNPDDPSLFIEKRFGIGWTLNFGRPLSWIIIFGILGFSGVFLIISTIMFK